MSDNMQEELDAVIRGLGRLGAVSATPAPVGSVRTLMPLRQASYPPGVQLGQAPTLSATGDLTVADALKRLAVMYGALQQAAGKIIAAFPAGPPCEIRDRHNRAVLAYKAIATPVFNALAAKGITPTQILLDKQGVPIKTIASSVPVLPTGWVMSDCPGGTKMPGLAGLGVFPILGLYWAILLVVTAAAGALIVRFWPTKREQFVQDYADWASTLSTCIQAQTAKGISAADAAVACKVLVPPPPTPPEDGPSVLAVFGKWVLVLGITGAVAYFLFRKFSPAEQQARARQMEAEEAAQRLRKEAERLVQAGRRPRYQRVQQRYAPAAAYGPEAEPEMPDDGGFEPEMPAEPRSQRYNGFQGAGARFKGCFCV